MNKRKHKLWLVVAIALAAFNLRAPITGVGSLIGIIQQDRSLSAGAAGIITTVPLIAFAIISPVVGKIEKGIGAGKAMLLGLSALALGIFIRSYGGTTGLFVGTAVIGLGIAFANVLLPGIIKSEFPGKVGMVTGIFTTSMLIFAGLSSGISVPLAVKSGFGWEKTLFIWIVLVIVAIVAWLRQGEVTLKTAGQMPGHSLIHSPTAWWVALYMGLQSLLYYCFVAWLPTILQAKGISPENAGYYASVFQLIGIPASFFASLIAGRKRSQSRLAMVIATFYFVGMILFLWGNTKPVLMVAVLLCGFCSGACVSIAMSLFGYRTRHSRAAASLSGMSQSFGYGLAAIGPFIMGGIYDAVGTWSIPILGLIVMILLLFIAGWQAGRDCTI